MTPETRRIVTLGAVFWPDRAEELLRNLAVGDRPEGAALAKTLAQVGPARRLVALAEAFGPAADFGRDGARDARLAARIQRERPQVAAALQALLLPPAPGATPMESSGPVSPVLARLACEWSWEERP